MRATSSALMFLLSASCLAGFASSAQAWDPNAGAEDTSTPARNTSPLTSRHYYAPAPVTYSAAPAAPQPALVMAPLAAAPVAAAPAVIAPAAQPVATNAPAPTYYVQPAPATATTYIAPYNTAPIATAYEPQTYTPPPASTDKVNHYALGVEGFWDRYREPNGNLESRTNYGALDGGWTHYYDPNWFSTVELRGSYGTADYKSVSGSFDGAKQWEYDARLLAGYDKPTGDGGHIKPYIGIDTRYYRDDGKGGVSDLGALFYDRRILQFMLPVGVTYDVPTANGFHFLPTVEGGPLLFGNVSSRLENIPGYYHTDSEQHSGYELRADFMMNNLNDQGSGFEFGPFVRYYHMDVSSVAHTPPAGPHGFTEWVEPNNSRLQLGAKLSYLF